MHGILESGTYPLIPVVSVRSPDQPLSPPPSNGSDSCIACSHVWYDGLGNPEGNAIPPCQLDRLRRLVRAVPLAEAPSPPSALWLYTISCPVEDGSKFKDIAIHMMMDTYKNASAILVLD